MGLYRIVEQRVVAILFDLGNCLDRELIEEVVLSVKNDSFSEFLHD
jgi:hypothetical protein